MIPLFLPANFCVMATIHKFVFNPFQENTYLLFDESGECMIIDPGCYDQHEKDEISDFIRSEKLTPVRLVYTHCHVDHMLGNNYICETYNLQPEIHKAGLPFLINAHQQGKVYGFDLERSVEPEKFIADEEIIRFGNTKLGVVYTPGHADGSVCFISEVHKFVIAGDVLFNGSIGRTDFPTGDFDLLVNSIHSRLFTLDDDYIVYSGHGSETTIGYEKRHNPFVRIL
jgi:hydroxyacylglutathione hydrolase